MKAWSRVPRSAAVVLVAIIATSTTGRAAASVAVFDMMNFFSNVAQNAQLVAIRKSLTDQSGGSLKQHAENIDKAAQQTNASSAHIAAMSSEISRKLDTNAAIDANFTWIITRGAHGDRIVPIPHEVKQLLQKVHAPGGSDDYAAHFEDASAYYTRLGGNAGDAAGADFEGSRARKAANDALVKIIDMEQGRLDDEAGGLEALATVGNAVEGQGRQLQIANALAGSQANQLIKMRSMMLASEFARAAEAQAAADKDARAIATGRHLREGLQSAIVASETPLPSL